MNKYTDGSNSHLASESLRKSIARVVISSVLNSVLDHQIKHLVLEHRVQHRVTSVPESQLASEQAPCLENYDYWKAQMMAFLKSIDSRTWKATVNRWEAPVVLDNDGNKTTEIKAIKDSSKDEDDLALGNSKALNAIFNGVDINMFRLVKRCTIAKNAWEILRKAREETSKVKLSKLQMLSTNFENLCMKEEETIHDFHMNILEFANSFDALG
ncbi:gag-protease polyprotein [Trifolium pratense]|uniref:Gag-protease polyprotein n=1 Tax=Trifolium pratense TaxID=57577 RepID=A0A2K3PIR4_TRIPR|nr:gag-protease polyprotein [Trifolium pratense]